MTRPSSTRPLSSTQETPATQLGCCARDPQHLIHPGEPARYADAVGGWCCARCAAPPGGQAKVPRAARSSTHGRRQAALLGIAVLMGIQLLVPGGWPRLLLGTDEADRSQTESQSRLSTQPDVTPSETTPAEPTSTAPADPCHQDPDAEITVIQYLRELTDRGLPEGVASIRNGDGAAVIASYASESYVFFVPPVKDGIVPDIYAHNGWAASLAGDDVYVVLKPGDEGWDVPVRDDPWTVLDPCVS